LLTLSNDWRWVVGASGFLWLATAEGTIARSALIARMRLRRLVVAEVGGAVAAVGIVVVWGHGGTVAAALVAALAIRHLAMHLLGRASLRACLDRTSVGDAVGYVLAAQVLAYVIANVDYVVAASFIGPSGLGIYVLGFRAANVLPAQLASGLSPVMLTELAAATDPTDRYHWLLRRLMGIGLLAAIATAAAAPALPKLLGERWTTSSWVVLALATAVPFRMSLGLAGSLALARRLETRLLRWELWRLGITTFVLGCAAQFGLRPFVLAVSVLTIGSHVGLHRAACRAVGLERPRVGANVIAVVCACVIVGGPWWPQQ